MIPKSVHTSKRSSSNLVRGVILPIVSARGGTALDKFPASENRRRGQALSEYLILTALVAVASIGVIQLLGSNLNRSLGEVAAALGGERKEITKKTVEEKHYEVRDLGDFNKAMEDKDSK